MPAFATILSASLIVALGMKRAIEKFLQYLQSVRNSSPHTIVNYGKDLEQFVTFLSPPGTQPPGVSGVTHLMIREFVGHLHELGLEKSSIARKLAALRSFFKYCVREAMIKENPARLVPTPKLPKRIPSVLSAEEMNGFLNQLAGMGPAAAGGRIPSKKGAVARARQRKQGTHRTVRNEGARGAGEILAAAGKAAAASGNSSGGERRGFSELCGAAANAAVGRENRKKVRQAGECQLGFASAFAAACVCHTPAGGWRGFAGHPGTAGAPVAVDDAEIYACFDTAIDGGLRQVASPRVRASEVCSLLWWRCLS